MYDEDCFRHPQKHHATEMHLKGSLSVMKHPVGWGGADNSIKPCHQTVLDGRRHDIPM